MSPKVKLGAALLMASAVVITGMYVSTWPILVENCVATIGGQLVIPNGRCARGTLPLWRRALGQ